MAFIVGSCECHSDTFCFSFSSSSFILDFICTEKIDSL